MTSFTLILLCTAGLFAALLQDRFRFWATLAVGLCAFLLALAGGFFLRHVIEDPGAAHLAACLLGSAIFFTASLFLHTNNLAQKLFLALLCPSCMLYLEVFLPQALGVMPFHTAGMVGGVLEAVLTLLLYLLMGLCLYRPFHHFSDRGPSAFMGGMCWLACLQFPLCMGKADFLFPGNPPAGRLLLSSLLFILMIFCFRSVYQAGRFRAAISQEENRQKLLERDAVDFGDLLAAVQEARGAHKNGEYALDTVAVMLQDGVPEQVPAYIYMAKHTASRAPILVQYHENPYLNAVIATKAAFAAQKEIDFQCNAVTGNVPLRTSELCVLFHEMLGRAFGDAVAYTGGPRRVRFTAIPGEDSLRLEAVYTGGLPEKPGSVWKELKGKKISDLVKWLFDDQPQDGSNLAGLENTAETVLLHSGRLTVSGTAEETILQAELRF